jgi:CRP-like cAMP-binding protein
MTELEQYIQSYFGIAREDMEHISTFFGLTTLRKGDYFLKAGQTCSQLSFQKSGIVRVYTEVGDKEVTQWISTGYFVTDLAGIIFNEPSKNNIQALTDCTFYTISRADYNRLGQVVPRWHELEKLFIARCFKVLENRVLTLLSMSAEERYREFYAGHKALFNQVPLQYLASMLGMTPETLSRIRKKEGLIAE